MARRATYHAYLLRLWRVSAGPPPVWRASLEDAHSGASMVFPSLERAYAFLAEQIAGPEEGAPPEPPAGEQAP